MVSSNRIKYVKILNGSSQCLVGLLLVKHSWETKDVIMHHYQIARRVGYVLVEIKLLFLCRIKSVLFKFRLNAYFTPPTCGNFLHTFVCGHPFTHSNLSISLLRFPWMTYDHFILGLCNTPMGT